jgi:hypothetical protein
MPEVALVCGLFAGIRGMDALIPRPNSVSRIRTDFGPPELEHPVQGIHSNGRHLTTMRARAEGITDHPLVPADRPFRQGAPIGREVRAKPL